MNKTVCRIFISFIILSSIISTILLCINFVGILILSNDTNNIYPNTQEYVLRQISENIKITENKIILTDTSIIPSDNWCILIDENGDIIWSHNKPDDIPKHYTINDIARLTHWFLNDYPVYVRTENYGLLILGIPKNTVGKYSMQYSMNWFDTLPRRILTVLAINLVLAAVLACIFGFNLYRKLKLITSGIKDLQREKRVNMEENGIFKEVIKSINDTSESIERKNAILSERDNARSNWIAGISHDIRTPLSLIMGYSETLSAIPDLSEENRKKAKAVTTQSIKMKKLIEDLNLISSLEYDMQPTKKKDVRLCPIIRGIVSELINNGLDDKFEINLDLQYEQGIILGDETLIERALFNLINNSINHNKNGCIINISEYFKNDNVCINISDNGKGVNEDILRNIDTIPKTSHGLGLPMAYKIFYVHNGKMNVKNDNGFSVLIELPIK